MPVPVMIVDDEQGIRDAVSFVLKGHGFNVFKVMSGDDCLKQVREGFQGIILMDIMMPGLDGLDTIRAIVKENLHIGNLFCLLTGKIEPGGKMIGLEKHVHDFLAKPFSSEDLLVMVSTADSYLIR